MKFKLGDDILGSGSYGNVFKGSMTCNGSDKVIAIKRIENDGRQNFFGKNALKEYEILQAVGRHDHIVELLGFEVDAQFFYILMEFCEQGSLEDYLEKSNPALDKKITIMHHCASALAYMHSRKPQIVHRDIKLANILIKGMTDDRIIAKMADFGLSTAFDPDGKKEFMTTNTGTMAFRAPEMFQRGPMRYTIAVDTFALGLVYLVMLNFDKTKLLEPNPVTLLDCPFLPFGQRLTLSEKENKQMPELFTITTSEPASVTQIKSLITQMTRVEASERILMTEVECLLGILVDSKSKGHTASCILQLQLQVKELTEKESLIVLDVQAKDSELQAKDLKLKQRDSQLQAKGLKLTQMDSELQEKSLKLKQKDSELMASKSCILQLQSQVKELTDKESMLEADVQAKDSQLKAKNSDLEAKDFDLMQSNRSIEHLRLKCDFLDEYKDFLQTQNNEMKKSMSELTNEVKTKEENIKVLDQQLKQNNTEMESTIKEKDKFKGDVQSRDKKIQDLEEKLRQIKSIMDS